jgi:hypothetical protein
MPIFMANVNGDWWEFEEGQALFVLNTDNLSIEKLAEIEEEYGPIDGSEDYPEKLHRAIWEHGHQYFTKPGLKL